MIIIKSAVNFRTLYFLFHFIEICIEYIVLFSPLFDWLISRINMISPKVSIWRWLRSIETSSNNSMYIVMMDTWYPQTHLMMMISGSLRQDPVKPVSSELEIWVFKLLTMTCCGCREKNQQAISLERIYSKGASYKLWIINWVINYSINLSLPNSML